jgi:hypothetical protein
MTNARKRDPLTLPPTQLQWSPVTQLGELNQFQRLYNASLDFAALDVPHPESESNVLRDSHMREESVILEDESNVAPEWWRIIDWLTSEPD